MNTSLAAQGDPMLPMFMPITNVKAETSDAFTFELRPESDFTFEPGQFNMLYAPGYGEVPISISGDPEQPSKLVHTIRAVGPVTRQLKRLGVGDFVGVRGPYGTAWPTEFSTDEQLVIVAGGIGLAPLRPAIYRALHRGIPLFLAYGARSPAERLYADELDTWAARRDMQLEVTVDRGDPGWRGKSGIVTKLIGLLGFDPEAAHGLACGPEAMMRFAAREMIDCGIAVDRLHVSLERNMKCGVGFCGHCQLGPLLLCKDGPVVPYAEARTLMLTREL